MLRTRIGEAIGQETQTPEKSYIAFSVCLAQYELEKLQPDLKTSVCAKMIARCYQIPESWSTARRPTPAPAPAPAR